MAVWRFLCLDLTASKSSAMWGWRMGESLGPLVERGGKKVFIHKEEILEATTERIATLKKFKGDLRDILHNDKNTGG